MKSRIGTVYYTGRSFWFQDSETTLICMSDVDEVNEGYVAKPGSFVNVQSILKYAEIVETTEGSLGGSEGDDNDYNSRKNR